MPLIATQDHFGFISNSEISTIMMDQDINNSDFTSPDFNPESMRVVDLKRVLTNNEVHYTSRDRKADLIKLFNTYILSPSNNNNQSSETNDKQVNKDKPNGTKNNLNKTKTKKTPTKSKKIDHAIPIADQRAKLKSLKRHFNEMVNIDIKNDDTELYRNETHLAKKQHSDNNISDSGEKINKKNVFQNGIKEKSKRKVIPKREPNDSKPDNSIDANDSANNKIEVKLESTPSKNTTFDRSQQITIDYSTVDDIQPSSILGSTGHLEEKNNTSDTNNVLSDLKTKKFDKSDDIKIDFSGIDKDVYASSTKNEINPIISESTANDSYISTAEEVQKPEIHHDNIPDLNGLSEAHRQLKGPTKDIRNDPLNDTLEISTDIDQSSFIQTNKLIKEDIKEKLKNITELKHDILDDLGKLESENDDLEKSGIFSKDVTFASNDLTFDNDSEIFNQLQNEFQIEHSIIEVEEDKMMEKIKQKEKFKYYKKQFIKITLIWILLLLVMFCISVYQQERIKIGFCGYENYTNLFIFKLFNYKLKCIDCPDHAICYENSKIECFPDYKISKPLFWSIFGFLPTFNKCVLDSTKIKRINKTLKYVVDLLSRRNASIKCGNGSDSEVGLNWEQIIEMVDQNFLYDPNAEFYNYTWDKVKLLLTTRSDLIFKTINNKEIIRSISLSKLSVNCRIKRLILSILLKYKAYFITILGMLTMFSYIFYSINQYQKRKELYNNIVKEIINKLQTQKISYRKTKQGHPYVAKIQLRDYYLPQFTQLSKKNQKNLWNQVVTHIEKNSNIKIEDVEVNGDIMRVWSWNSSV